MKERIITAIIALILFIPLVLFGGWPFIILIYAMATIGLTELMGMRKIGKYSIPSFLAIVLLWLILIPSDLQVNLLLAGKSDWIMLFVLVLLMYTVLVKNKFAFDDAGFLLLATIYVGMGFYYFIETRMGAGGLANVFFVLFVVWATDTGAYFFGRAFGKNKLWPKISPNKTVEGAIGGIILGAIVAIVYHLIHPFPYSVLAVVGVAVLVSLFGQIGDLVESAFKRHFGVKDSGNILPGHGGILDRMDSLIFVFPILHFIQFI